MAKLSKKLVALGLCICSLGGISSLAACGGGKGTVNDGKTVNVKVYKGGYGTTWLYQVKEKFEAAYASEGYKINILTPDTSLKGPAALNEMRLGTKSGVDLYITNAVDVDGATSATYGICVEDITDMYNQPALTFNKTEESKTVGEKLRGGYHDAVSLGDKYYGYLWASVPCGLAVNTKVLSNYSLEIPNTTNELFACYTTISATSSSTGVYPFAWGGNNAYGYALYSLYANVAQMLGEEEYEHFRSLQAGDTIVEADYTEGYKLYENEDIYTAIEIMKKQYDSATSVIGAAGHTHDQSHHNLMSGKAAFSVDCESLFSEVRANYSQYLQDITFVNTPVNSALGTKLGISDEVLSYAVSLVDAGKTESEIIAEVSSEKSVTLTAEQTQKIMEARGALFEKADHIAYITKGSSVADIAKLFLRMLASDEAATIFNEKAYAISPYAAQGKTDTQYTFVNNVAKVVNNANTWSVQSTATGLRKKAAMDFFTPYGSDIVKSGDTAAQMVEKIKKSAITDWATHMNKAGY